MALAIKKQWFVGSKTEDIRLRYAIIRELGSGSSGRVYLAQDRLTLEQRGVKQIQKSRIRDFRNEMEILRHMDHPNIIKVVDTYESELYCYLVLEYCEGGDLLSRIATKQQLHEYEAAYIMRKLIAAVAYCHNRGVCHRDLKPENCLMSSTQEDSDIKLIDFGLSQVVDEDELMHSLSGTAYYIAPEVLGNSYGKEVDCWSLGVILYLILSGVHPFTGRNNEQILAAVFNAHYTFKPLAFQFVSSLAKDLISKLLVKDPRLRMKAKDALNHPWVQVNAPLAYTPLPNVVLEGLQGFIRAQHLRKATLMYIASQLSEKDVENLRRVFESLDKNGDGIINKRELLEGISLAGQMIESKNFEDLWEMMDTNQNGLIDYTEFLAGCLHNLRIQNTGYLQSAFEYFDIDKSGFISADEIKEIFKNSEVNTNIPDDQIDRIIHEIDRNGDGRIDYKEFILMMSTHL